MKEINRCIGSGSSGKRHFKRSMEYGSKYECVYCNLIWSHIFTELKEVVTDPNKFLYWDEVGWGMCDLRVGTRA